jgi:hypothetical protein
MRLRCLTMYRPPLRAEAVRFRDLLGCRVDVHVSGEFAHAFSVIIALMLVAHFLHVITVYIIASDVGCFK